LPCGSGFAKCCQLWHEEEPRRTRKLMRSRYGLRAGTEDYLLATGIANAPQALDLAPPQPRWLGLRCCGTRRRPMPIVEFIARYKEGGRVHREVSRFVREGGWWFYLDGKGG
jgi:uncharacterized protein YchJ